jgi:hypothetical protein
MIDTVKQFRQRHGLSQGDLGQLLGKSLRWVSNHDSRKQGPLLNLALEALGRKLIKQKQHNTLTCPECRAPMRPRNWYLKDWYYGRLKACFSCKGSSDEPHSRVGLALLPNGELQRLDRVTNPVTGVETKLRRKRKNKTPYEREYGWVWCDQTSGRQNGCQGICKPEGLYRFHKDGVFQIFRCMNPDCIFGRKRLYCRGGKCYESGSIPSAGRQSTLPEKARVCTHCKTGRTESRGKRNAPLGQIQLHCTDCGKISYFDLLSGKCLPGRAPGGKKPEDPNRPKCRKCSREMNRHQIRKSLLDARPTVVPIPVRKKQLLWDSPNKRRHEVLLIKYYCPHSHIYLTPAGQLIHRRNAQKRAPWGKTFNYVLNHPQGGRPPNQLAPVAKR